MVDREREIVELPSLWSWLRSSRFCPRNDFACLRLNRPERKNALNDELFGALFAAFREAAHDDDVWAIAITGNGDAFCSGLDLNQSSGAADSEGDANDDSSAERDDASNHLSIIMRVECEKPILAGVNGVAVGIGLSLAMNADIRIAAPSARFHPGYARVATSPDGGLTWTLTRAVGYDTRDALPPGAEDVVGGRSTHARSRERGHRERRRFRGTVVGLRPDARKRGADRGSPDKTPSRADRSTS